MYCGDWCGAEPEVGETLSATHLVTVALIQGFSVGSIKHFVVPTVGKEREGGREEREGGWMGGGGGREREGGREEGERRGGRRVREKKYVTLDAIQALHVLCVVTKLAKRVVMHCSCEKLLFMLGSQDCLQRCTHAWTHLTMRSPTSLLTV